MNERNNKLLWIPFIALCLGVGLPSVVIGVSVEGPKSGIWGGAFSATAWLIFTISIDLKKLNEACREWLTNSISGLSLLLFLGGLTCSVIAGLFVTIPVPIWAGYLLVVIYLVSVMYYFFRVEK